MESQFWQVGKNNTPHTRRPPPPPAPRGRRGPPALAPLLGLRAPTPRPGPRAWPGPGPGPGLGRGDSMKFIFKQWNLSGPCMLTYAGRSRVRNEI